MRRYRGLESDGVGIGEDGRGETGETGEREMVAEQSDCQSAKDEDESVQLRDPSLPTPTSSSGW